MIDTPQLTTRRLFLWTLYFATFAAGFSALSTTPLSLSVAAIVAVAFGVADARFHGHFRGWLGISYFACAMAYIVAVGFVVMLLYPPPPPPRPGLSYWWSVYHLLSGGYVREMAQEIGGALSIIATYLMTFMAFTMTSTAIALLTVRRHRESKSLLVLNTPGIVFTVLCFCVAAFENQSAN